MRRIPLQARLDTLAGTDFEGLPLTQEDSVADFFEGAARESRSPYPRWVLDQLKKEYMAMGEPLSGGLSYLALTARTFAGAKQEETDGEPGAMTELLYRLTIEPFTLLEDDLN